MYGKNTEYDSGLSYTIVLKDNCFVLDTEIPNRSSLDVSLQIHATTKWYDGFLCVYRSPSTIHFRIDRKKG